MRQGCLRTTEQIFSWNGAVISVAGEVPNVCFSQLHAGAEASIAVPHGHWRAYLRLITPYVDDSRKPD